MKKIFFTALICMLAYITYGQTSTKTEKVRQLLELMGSGKLAEQVASQMITLFQNAYTDVDKQFWDEFSKEMKTAELLELIVPIYEKYYTEEEVEQLVTFYKTPLGKKVTESLPMITQESMEAGRMWGEGIGMKVVQRLREEGYIKD